MAGTYVHLSALTAVRVARELRTVGWHAEVVAMRTGEWQVRYWEKRHERKDEPEPRLNSPEN